MEEKRDSRFKWQMLEMADGITTSNGNWYHITREGINEYIPGLLQAYTLEKILKEADAWLKSADALALVLYFILVFVGIGPLLSAGISLVFYAFWFLNTSAFVLPSLGGIIRTIQMEGVIYTISGCAFIYLAFSGNLTTMWIGIGLFFLFKVGLLRLGIRFVQKKKESTGIQLPDRVLNMLLIRYGIKEGKLTGDIEEMEKNLIRIANLHKQKKK